MNKINNESKRTICYYNNQIIGIIDVLLNVKDVYKIEGIDEPLICYSILDIPKTHSKEDKDYFDKINCEKMAYFCVNKHLSEKLKSNYKRKTSQQQEKSLAKKIGGKVQIASGALSSFKGDVVHEKYLIEAKYSDSNEYRLALQTWNKIKKEAHEVDKMPLLEVCLDYDGKKPIKILICSPSDLDLTMDEFVLKFYSKHLKSDTKTILLKKEEIEEHIEMVNYNIPNLNPAFLINIGETLLIGAETDILIKVLDV